MGYVLADHVLLLEKTAIGWNPMAPRKPSQSGILKPESNGRREIAGNVAQKK
jgi:hypothetical protein